jgi:hypothetical protein
MKWDFSMARAVRSKRINCRPTLAAALLLLTACAKNTDHTPLRLNNAEYEIDGNLGGTAVSGQILFTDTEYRLISTRGSCSGNIWNMRHPATPNVHMRCGSLQLRLLNRDGNLQPRAYATVTDTVVAGSKQVCVRWSTDANGKRVCAALESRPVYRAETRTGYLEVTSASGMRY